MFFENLSQAKIVLYFPSTFPSEDTMSSGGDEQGKEDIVNPWEVQGSSEKGVDYEKLISKCPV